MIRQSIGSFHLFAWHEKYKNAPPFPTQCQYSAGGPISGMHSKSSRRSG
jgi:hypothetical protein